METNNILQADILDILFDGKNKEYGAYELRKTYPRRLITALLLTVGIFASLYIANQVIAAHTPKKTIPPMFGPEIDLAGVKKQDKKKEIKLPPVKPKQVEIKQVEIKKFVTPKIVDDNLVKNPPPAQIDLDGVKIGDVDRKGLKYDGTLTVLEPTTTVHVAVTREEVDTTRYIAIQIPAQFPGGEVAWRRFLERNLNNDLPGENGAEPARYTVVVSFLVDKEGNISEVKAENDPGHGTADEAVRVVKRGPKWIPAEQNGQKVVYRQKQGIVFNVVGE